MRKKNNHSTRCSRTYRLHAKGRRQQGLPIRLGSWSCYCLDDG